MKHLHEKAMALARDYRRTESVLLGILMEMQVKSLFLPLGFRNLFDYALRALQLSEAQASYFLHVARKAEVVPELKTAVDTGRINLSKARRIAPVITSRNSAEWIEKAATLPQRELERAVTLVNPSAFCKDRVRPIAPERSELRVGISTDVEKKLKRVQDLLSQKTAKAATLEEAIDAMAEAFLERNDPVRKAERASPKKPAPTPEPRGRRPRPAAVNHAVNRRDQGRCAHQEENGNRCQERRWLHVHHRLPVARGGTNDPQNLVTLCSAHHAMHHLEGRKGPTSHQLHARL